MNLDPAVGSEANKTRAAILVGRNALAERARERRSGVVTVVPTMTKNLDSIFDLHLRLPAARTGLAEDRKALAEYLRSVSILYLVKRAESVPADLMDELDERIRVWLDL